MARITVEDCLKRAKNRFVLVNMVAKRVRQIREGSEYLVSSPKNEDIVVALREIAAGKVSLTSGDQLPLPGGTKKTASTEAKKSPEAKKPPESETAQEGEKAAEAEAPTDPAPEAPAGDQDAPDEETTD